MRKLTLLLYVGISIFLGHQAFAGEAKISDRFDTTLRSLTRGSTMFRSLVHMDKRRQIRLLMELKPGADFPKISGLTAYGHIGRIYSASASISALRKLRVSPALKRAEIMPKYRLRRFLGSSSILMHSAKLDKKGTKSLVYKLTVPRAGTIKAQLFSEVTNTPGGTDAKFVPALALCSTSKCTNPIDSDFPNYGKADKNDNYPKPESHASLEYTFKQAGSIYIEVAAEFGGEGTFVLMLSSHNIDLKTGKLEEGGIHKNALPRSTGTRASITANKHKLTGKGVLVGVIDSGIDWCHKDFQKADGTSRILYIWDQGLTANNNETSPDAKIVGQADYGVEYTQKQINGSLKNCDRKTIRSFDTNGHGTHVAGIAAGGGSSPGVAPEADLVIIKGLEDIVSGMRYLVHKSITLKRPIVINMSLGGHDSSHDGTTLGERAINAIIGPGVNVVTAASNEGAHLIHAKTQLATGQGTNLRYQIDQTSKVILLHLFTDASDTFDIKLTIDGKTHSLVWGKSIQPAQSGLKMELGLGLSHPANPKLLKSYINIQSSQPWKAQEITLSIVRTKGTGSGIWHAYDVTEKGQFLNHVSKHKDGSVQGTMASPGTSRGTIAAGSYDLQGIFDIDGRNYFLEEKLLLPGSLSSFSSRGPTRDGRPGITLLAPGNYIDSTMTGHVYDCKKDPKLGQTSECQGLIGGLTLSGTYVSAGTSMATPMTTGTIALLLQKDPKLYARPLLASTAQKPAWAPGAQANQWGAGLLDIPAAMEKWSTGKAPIIQLDTIDGKRKGVGPWTVTLQVKSTNGVVLKEFMWSYDTDFGNNEIGTISTHTVVLKKLGVHTLSVVAASESGKNVKATIQLEVLSSAGEIPTEQPKGEEKSQEAAPSEAGSPEGPQQDAGSGQPEADPQETPQTESKPTEMAPEKGTTKEATQNKGNDAGATLPETQEDEGCGCQVGNNGIPSGGVLFVIFLLFFLRYAKRQHS